MNARRIVSSLLLAGIVAYSAVLAMARPPTNDAERKQRVSEMYQAYTKQFPEVTDWTPEQLLERLHDDNVVIVDVREPKEQAVSMIPGALTKEQFEARKDELKGKTVVAYCTIGFRSGMYVQELAEEGVQAINLAGSLLAWTHAGGPLERNGSTTTDVHVYGARWALTAEGYRGIY